MRMILAGNDNELMHNVCYVCFFKLSAFKVPVSVYATWESFLRAETFGRDKEYQVA